MTALVDVALGTRNRTSLPAALDSLALQTLAPRIALHVMDGNDDDRVRACLAARTWPFHSIAVYRDADAVPETQRTWPRLYNFLFARGAAPTLTYWSDDLEIHERDGFELAVARFDDARVGAVVFAERTDPQLTYAVSERRFGLAIHFGMIRRAAFEEAGGLHEGYRFWYADDDLTLRILRRGYAVVPLPAVRVHNRREGWCNPDMGAHADGLLFLDRWRHEPWCQGEWWKAPA